MRNKGIIVVLLLILAVTRNGLSQTVPWSVQVTGNNQTIFVPKSLVATIENGTLASGDVIGVFYSVQGVLKCGGLVEWKGNDTFLIAYGENGSQNGFQPQDTFVFKIWRKAQNCILESVTTQFEEPDQVLITSKDKYEQDGISQINQISSSTSSILYAKNTFCKTDTSPLPIITGQVDTLQFLNSSGLKINKLTGEIDLKNSITGKYTIRFQTKTCLKVDSFEIVIAAVPSFSLGKDTTICQGDSINLKPSLSNGSFLWSTGSTASQLNVKTAREYWLKYTDTNNCSVSDTIVISTSQLDLTSLKTTITNATCKMSGVLQINENTIKGGQRPYRYTIKNDLIAQTIETQANMISLNDGTNSLTIQDTRGCVAQGPLINIARAENCNHPILVPDSQGEFSSFYIPYSSGIAKIYDRSGKLKKQMHLPANWDGKDESGNIVPMGDYYIVCEGEKSLIVTVIK